MKRFLIGLLSGILIMTACAPATVESTILPSPSGTPTVVPATLTPSLTQIPPTRTITPLPTIPTFTPTFDVSTIVTVTPGPRAECLSKGAPPQINFAIFPSGKKYVGHPTIDEFLEFLNSGGHLEELANDLKQIDSEFEVKDITNDQLPDLIIISGSVFQTVNILWCQGGKYSLFPKDSVEGETLGSDQVKFELHDLNQNGISEVLSIGSGRTGLNVNILEWNGINFHDLSADEEGINAFMTYAARDDFEVRDLNNDGIPEFILKGSPPQSRDYPGDPLRSQTAIYYWSGKVYSPMKTFSAPQYRFQAVQDGDLQALQGNYSEATKLYQAAISSNKLDWWSKERFEHNREAAINFTTPTVLAPDKTEYPRLAAYAYYRIMLLHIVQGHEPDAGTVYKTLQQKFGNDPYGHPYVEMAIAFWEAYQSTHKMYTGCAAAIQYAAEHPEILVPLGSDYHGSQSHIYVPADVCPFR
ncbi:MAG: hypothetical protein JW730_20695 [Anaerolineales bacterium]|nr:hypothetical protein [Anaerolineales bacterium]